MVTVEIFFRKMKFNKSTKNQNFYIILGRTVAIRVPNMYIKFRKDRYSSLKKKINTA